MQFGGNKSSSKVQYYPGQQEALTPLFSVGGLFDQLLSGKPSVGAERTQATGLQQLQRTQASQGVGGQPIAARQATDYVVQSGRSREQDFLENLRAFMAPAGQTSSASGMSGGLGS